LLLQPETCVQLTQRFDALQIDSLPALAIPAFRAELAQLGSQMHFVG
jgi:hypothetical protein